MTDTDSLSLDSGPRITDWPLVTDIPELGFGGLHLWRLQLNSESRQEDVEALLSETERARAQSIKNQAAKRIYQRARAAKRLILAGYLGIEPAQLELDAGHRGKPFIAAPESDLQFNLTHSGELAMLAVTRGTEIGLDAEQLRARNGLLRIAERMFGAPIAQSLKDLGEKERQRRFHVLWTRLEAGVKTYGGGLFDPDSREAGGLCFNSFVPLPGYQACVAMPAECPEPEHWRTMTFRV